MKNTNRAKYTTMKELSANECSLLFVSKTIIITIILGWVILKFNRN